MIDTAPSPDETVTRWIGQGRRRMPGKKKVYKAKKARPVENPGPLMPFMGAAPPMMKGKKK